MANHIRAVLLLVGLLAPVFAASLLTVPLAPTPAAPRSETAMQSVRNRPALEVAGAAPTARFAFAHAERTLAAGALDASFDSVGLSDIDADAATDQFSIEAAPEPKAIPAPVPALKPAMVEVNAVIVMVTAHESVAALGAASLSAPQIPQASHLLSGGARHAAGVGAATGPVASFDSQSAWLIVLCWSVFLASLGIVVLRRTSLVALGLYARLRRHQMEEHPRRAMLLQLIQEEPGIHVAVLRRRSGLAAGVVRHHLDQLLHHGLVRRVREGRSTHFYVHGTAVAPSSLASPDRLRVLDAFAGGAPMTTPQIASRLRMSVQGAWKHLLGLERLGLVAARPSGRARMWSPNPA
jgi:predicted transcriptional regulator